MAEIPQGAGQQEAIGFGSSKRAPEAPGLYYEPKSKTYMHVAHYAAADALVRMGFKLVEEGQKVTASMEAKLSGVAKQEASADDKAKK